MLSYLIRRVEVRKVHQQCMKVENFYFFVRDEDVVDLINVPEDETAWAYQTKYE